MKRFLILCVLIAGIAAVALPQAATGAADVQIPPFTTHTLGNGLTVVLMEYHQLPLVELVMTVGGGRALEPDSLTGLASMTAELLRQGTQTRTATQIAEQVDFVGGVLRTSAGLDQFTISGEFLTKDLPAGLALFSDVILHPVFPQEEIDRERSQRLATLESIKEEPGNIASIAYNRRVYGMHPYGRQALGTHASLPRMTRDAIIAFERQTFVPNNALLVVVGDFQEKAMLASVESAFGMWPRGTAPSVPSVAPKRISGRHVVIIDKPDVTQSQIRIGNTGVDILNPDRYTLQVANTILGGGFTSRLVEEIRVKRSLTYGANSSFASARQGGTFTVSTFTKNRSLRTTIDVALAELKKIREHGVSAAELSKAQNYIAGSFARNLQAPENLAAQLSTMLFYHLPDDYLRGYVRRIHAVTLADINRVVPKDIPYDDLLILVVSNPAETRAQLEGLGPIEVVPLNAAVE